MFENSLKIARALSTSAIWKNFQISRVMVIELSGVQFGLKSYVWFQNRTNAQREFDLKAHVWF